MADLVKIILDIADIESSIRHLIIRLSNIYNLLIVKNYEIVAIPS